ncbi:barstar family protein [Streptomyces brasiliensis]|uniref:Barstar (barnase inhibitor) domain-containing protein n=1 Tax=Streptomyces brasiliensis TaxID=1954 RepID=A0A917NGT2_9ACTN|nr:barstar family protein [Streptomyces brasiliensis]GGJ00096.1 hypothetical protein GCM10010121_008040 [Streptomyces brasiliensis]
MLDAARGAGWSVAVLDLGGAAAKEGLMDRCARALSLPAWFGRNWDALYDVFTDVSFWPGVPGTGRLLAVTGWTGFTRAYPGDWETAQGVFADAVDAAPRTAGPPLNVVLLLGTAPGRSAG